MIIKLKMLGSFRNFLAVLRTFKLPISIAIRSTPFPEN